METVEARERFEPLGFPSLETPGSFRSSVWTPRASGLAFVPVRRTFGELTLDPKRRRGCGTAPSGSLRLENRKKPDSDSDYERWKPHLEVSAPDRSRRSRRRAALKWQAGAMGFSASIWADGSSSVSTPSFSKRPVRDEATVLDGQPCRRRTLRERRSGTTPR